MQYRQPTGAGPSGATGTGAATSPLRRAVDLALWAALLGVLAWRFGPQLLAASGTFAEDTPAPPFVIETLDGGRLASDDLRGRVLVVNFWATWCGPCRLEMPGFERVHRDRSDDGVFILGLSTDVTGRDGVRAFVRERGVTYPIAMATPQLRAAFGGFRGIPTTILIDRQGVIRHRITGFMVEPVLRAAIARLLGPEDPLQPETGSGPRP